MDLSSRVLGVRVATQLGERVRAPLLRIGADVFTRADLAGVACFNFIAAANLSAALAAHGVIDTKHAFNTVSPASLAVPRIGAIAIAVLGAAFEAKRVGGPHPLEAWITKHRDKQSRRDVVSFLTVKHHRADTEDADRKQRKHARRNMAHRTRVRRFTTRQQPRTSSNG